MKYILLSCLFMFDVFAGLPIAEVVMVRGKATVLRPGGHNAYLLKMTDKILVDSSIVTGEKSFVRLQFKDATIVNVGPNSKMVISEFNKDEAGVIDLLKGRLRTSVQKESGNTKNKFFIKTRTAAMAVRGTDFQTVYNPENKNTALLTYKGEVAMVKLTEDQIIEKKVIVKDIAGQNEKEVITENTAHNLDTANGLQKVLDANKETTVVTKAGQYSGSVPGLSRATVPVKVSPLQLESLYKNDTLNDKGAGEKITSVKNETGSIIQAEQTSPPEGFFNRKTNEYAPRAGGYVDARTGLYIPPIEGSILDEKNGVYVSKDTGTIDGQSGQYIAPKGIKLDASAGFVVVGDDKNEGLLAQTELLNKTIKSDVVLVAPAQDFNGHENAEFFTNHDLIFSYRAFSEELNYSSDSVMGPRVFKAASASEMKIDWEQAGMEKWKTHAFIGFKDIHYNDIGSETSIQGSDSLMRMGAGIKYALAKSWTLKWDLSIDQNFFVNYDSGVTQLVKVAMTKSLLALQWTMFQGVRWSADIGFGLVLNPAKETGALKVESGLGTDLNANLNYWWGRHFRSVLGLWSLSQTNTSKAAGFEAESERMQRGLNLGLQYHFD